MLPHDPVLNGAAAGALAPCRRPHQPLQAHSCETSGRKHRRVQRESAACLSRPSTCGSSRGAVCVQARGRVAVCVNGCAVLSRAQINETCVEFVNEILREPKVCADEQRRTWKFYQWYAVEYSQCVSNGCAACASHDVVHWPRSQARGGLVHGQAHPPSGRVRRAPVPR